MMRVCFDAGRVVGGCARTRLRTRLAGSPGSDLVRRTRLGIGGSTVLAGRFDGAVRGMDGCSLL